jgi:hypothetical protein
MISNISCYFCLDYIQAYEQGSVVAGKAFEQGTVMAGKALDGAKTYAGPYAQRVSGSLGGLCRLYPTPPALEKLPTHIPIQATVNPLHTICLF